MNRAERKMIKLVLEQAKVATFGKFFFGNLAAVYLPGLDRLGEFASGLMRSGRG